MSVTTRFSVDVHAKRLEQAERDLSAALVVSAASVSTSFARTAARTFPRPRQPRRRCAEVQTRSRRHRPRRCASVVLHQPLRLRVRVIRHDEVLRSVERLVQAERDLSATPVRARGGPVLALCKNRDSSAACATHSLLAQRVRRVWGRRYSWQRRCTSRRHRHPFRCTRLS